MTREEEIIKIALLIQRGYILIDKNLMVNLTKRFNPLAIRNFAEAKFYCLVIQEQIALEKAQKILNEGK